MNFGFRTTLMKGFDPLQMLTTIYIYIYIYSIRNYILYIILYSSIRHLHIILYISHIHNSAISRFESVLLNVHERNYYLI